MIRLNAQDLAAIRKEVKSLKSNLEALLKVQKAFAIIITNEIADLFAKVDARVQGRPSKAVQAGEKWRLTNGVGIYAEGAT